MEIFRSDADNRKYPRFPFRRAVRFKVQEADSYHGEVAQDLSSGGIRLCSEIFIPVGEVVSVGIQFKDSDRVIDVVGRVRWIRYHPYSEMYQIGVEFFEAENSFPRERIGHFLGSTDV